MHTKVIAASIGNCAGILGAEQGPLYLQKRHPAWPWHVTVSFVGHERKLAAIPALVDFLNHLASSVQELIQIQHRFCVIGGDHSCAIGTWSGVANALKKPFGLIWIDAHMDAHTIESSTSKNPHGMPLAVLLGDGDQRLMDIATRKPALSPQHVVMIGIRSYEPAEEALLKSLGVKVYYMPEVQERGFNTILAEAHHYLLQRVDQFGITFDIDGLDPLDCDATGTKEPDGISAAVAIEAFKKLDKTGLVGCEITEFNPTLGNAEKTAAVIEQLVYSMTGVVDPV